jgi:hypothetical protein
MRNAILTASLLFAAACTADVASAPPEDTDATAGVSINITPDLSGCHGHASSTVPADDRYVMTTFGGGADTQSMSCGGTADGVGWYAASRQRFGCGAKIQVEANGVCVVLAALDYGPDVCVEAAAHMPILDMSPRASKALYGVSGAGWSDHLVVTATEVDASTPLGPCSDTGGGSGSGSGSGSGGGGDAACASSTLDRDVDTGTCVESATDANWYQCENGQWNTISSTADCTASFGYCHSATLGKDVPARTCVQSGSSGIWYQCNGQGWASPVDTSAHSGPIGACSTWNPR